MDIKRASDSYQKMNHSIINIVKSYLRSIRRARILLSKVDRRFYLNLLAYVRDTYKNTKSPDNPKELSGNTKLVFQTTLNTMLNYAVKKGLLCGIPSMTQLSEVILNHYT